MKEKTPIEKDNEQLNAACRRAQLFILDPLISDASKDKAVDQAIETINQIAERKARYDAKNGEGVKKQK